MTEFFNTLFKRGIRIMNNYYGEQSDNSFLRHNLAATVLKLISNNVSLLNFFVIPGLNLLI